MPQSGPSRILLTTSQSQRAYLYAGQTPDRPQRSRKFGLEESELASALEGVGPRRDTELAVDRPDVAVHRVVGHVQLTADVPLGQIAVQQSEHPQFPLRQLLIPG